jgi:hypothetical protein
MFPAVDKICEYTFHLPAYTNFNPQMSILILVFSNFEIIKGLGDAGREGLLVNLRLLLGTVPRLDLSYIHAPAIWKT